MEKRANEFLKLSGELYEANKKKWKLLVKEFDEDVYNDTIIKVYEHILRGEDTEGDLVGYWFKSFKNNLNRNKKYISNKSKESLDIVKDTPLEEDEDTPNISDILLGVRNHFDRKTFEVFRMYLLCNVSYDKLDELTKTDSKDRIMKVKKWLKNNDFKNSK